MTNQPGDLAERLLDAQVAFILAELSAQRLPDVVARDVDDLLKATASITVSQLVDREQVKTGVREIVLGKAGGSEVVRSMTLAVADAVYVHSANDEHRLGEVVDRDQVRRLIATIIGMRTLHEEVLERLSKSPVVATVASWFVTKLVSDVMQQNRERAEKIPGVSSLFAVGERAADRVRGATSRHLDQFLGDMAGKGAQLAMRRVNTAIRHTMNEAPLEEAVMEVWDLHADDHVSGLKDYLSQEELRELAEIGHEIWTDVRGTEYLGEVVSSGIDVFFDTYGDHPLPALLADLDLDRDDVVREVLRYVPRIVEALEADGQLAALIRARLEPFFRSDAVRELLAGGVSAEG